MGAPARELHGDLQLGIAGLAAGGHERVDVVEAFAGAVLVEEELDPLETQGDLAGAVARPVELAPSTASASSTRPAPRSALAWSRAQLEPAVVVDERHGVVEMAQRVLEGERVS